MRKHILIAIHSHKKLRVVEQQKIWPVHRNVSIFFSVYEPAVRAFSSWNSGGPYVSCQGHFTAPFFNCFALG